MELIKGKDYVAFFRRLADIKTQDASKIRFQTEATIQLEKESDSSITKDGNVNTITDGENTASFTSLAYREDNGTKNMWKELKKWYIANDKVEFWLVDMGSKNSQNKYEVEYFQGYFTSFEISAPADDKVELSYEMAIDGNGVSGLDTLTSTQLQAVNAAQYDYQALKAGGGTPV